MPIQQIELANLILDQVNEHIDDAFLEQEGIFRLSGVGSKAREAYQKARKFPKRFHLSKMGEDFLINNNNVVSLLKKSLLDKEHPIEFHQETATYLNEREAFIKEGKYLEEAKLLHNLIYLSRRIVEHEIKNKMTAKNVSIALLGPKIVEWLNKDAEELAQEELKRKGISHFDKPFQEVYPHLQLKKASTSRLKRAKKSLKQKRDTLKKGIKGGIKGANRKRKAMSEAIKRAVKRRKKEPSETAVWYDSPQAPSTTWVNKELLSDALQDSSLPQKEKSPSSPKRAIKPEAWPSDVSPTQKKYQPILSPIKENYAQETKMHYEDVKREKRGQRGKPITIERENNFNSLKRKFGKQQLPSPKNKPHLGA